MKNILQIGLIVLVFIISCNSSKQRSFLNGKLTFIADSDWIAIMNDGKEQLENENDGTSISFTLFEGPDDNVDNFSKIRFDSVDSTTWKEVDNEINPESNYNIKMKKYISSDSLYNYMVCVIGNGNTFLSFTIVVDNKKYDALKTEMIEIIESIKI